MTTPRIKKVPLQVEKTQENPPVLLPTSFDGERGGVIYKEDPNLNGPDSRLRGLLHRTKADHGYLTMKVVEDFVYAMVNDPDLWHQVWPICNAYGRRQELRRALLTIDVKSVAQAQSRYIASRVMQLEEFTPETSATFDECLAERLAEMVDQESLTPSQRAKYKRLLKQVQA